MRNSIHNSALQTNFWETNEKKPATNARSMPYRYKTCYSLNDLLFERVVVKCCLYIFVVQCIMRVAVASSRRQLFWRQATTSRHRRPQAKATASTVAAAAVEAPPTNLQLRRVFWHAAVPMVGFGFMDNSGRLLVLSPVVILLRKMSWRWIFFVVALASSGADDCELLLFERLDVRTILTTTWTTHTIYLFVYE